MKQIQRIMRSSRDGSKILFEGCEKRTFSSSWRCFECKAYHKDDTMHLLGWLVVIASVAIDASPLGGLELPRPFHAKSDALR